MSSPMKSLLFIPDISGFTNYVKHTEINHSRHIIAELLELIIDSNDLDLTVSEIEGDAVLFYKTGDLPTVQALLEQSKKMFVAFHNHLKSYQAARICQCGACTSASGLSLKIIVHFGEIELIKVKNHTKPYGQDVILVHRLLKNSIDINEYVLLTDTVDPAKEGMDAYRQTNSWVKVIPGSSHDENLGTLSFDYIPLSGLYSLVSESPPVPQGLKNNHPISKEILLDKPSDEVFEIITNFDYRLLWNKDISNLSYDLEKVNRVGSRHRCFIGSKEAEFETVTNYFGPDKQVYGENFINPPIVKRITFYYIMAAENDQTRLTLNLHYENQPIYGWLLEPFFRMILQKQMTKVAAALVKVCEEVSLEPAGPDVSRN